MSSPEDPSILIVGAGIGGLFTALELHRNGYRKIRLVDRSKRITSAGDFFAMVPSCLATLHLYPDMLPEFNDQDNHDIRVYTWTGEHIFGPAEAEFNREDAVKSAASLEKLPFLVQRAGFYEMVLKGVERRYIPVDWNTHVTKFGEDESKNVAWVDLEDGRRLEADLVIAADGIGTKSHEAVTGHTITPYSSGFAVLRCTVPTETIFHSQFVINHLGWSPGDRAQMRTYIG